MKNNKKRAYLFLTVIALFLVWYFFFKPYDYTINFKSNTFPEAINQSLKLWGDTNKNVLETQQLQDMSNLEQTLKFADSVHIYNWKINPETDSTSQITVGIKDKNWTNSIWNRLQVPFISSDFSKKSENTVLDFMHVLKEHVDNFKVTIVGIEEMPVKHIAYVSVHKRQLEKAGGMMDNHTFLNDVLIKNGIKLDGRPIIEVTDWDMQKDSVFFNFGYPIKPSDSLPKNTEIKYKKLNARKGIKAIYNGNYITSDRAWYALLSYAEKNNLEIDKTPLEIFYNNPNMGGDALKWKTEVYLPLIEKK